MSCLSSLSSPSRWSRRIGFPTAAALPGPGLPGLADFQDQQGYGLVTIRSQGHNGRVWMCLDEWNASGVVFPHVWATHWLIQIG